MNDFLPLDQSRTGGAFQIVATLGPASMKRAGELAAAGATAFRLNASHLSLAELEQALEAVGAAAPGAPVVLDLQGAKMRLGRFSERAIAAGERIAFSVEAGSAGDLSLPHPELFAALSAGDVLEADDGRLRFRIERAVEGRIEATVLEGGILRPRKGVNLAAHPVALTDLSAADAAFATAAGSRVGFALSFMQDGREVAWLRRRVPGATAIGKIERREAIENLSAIARAVDAIWICRGDLGVQLGLAAMAHFVGGFDPKPLPCPVLLAGQVLEHLTRGREMTRSEACHLRDVVARGYAGIVLSDETAIGGDPVRAVAVASRFVREVLAG